MITKQQLIAQLHQTYVTAKPSTTHGIGVFAIANIPKGCRDMFTHEQGEWIALTHEEVNNLPTHAKLLIETYCLFDNKKYYVPAQGFKVMDLSYYLNHSSTPNIISINDGEFFEAIRDIQTGEELFIDYGEIVNSKE